MNIVELQKRFSALLLQRKILGIVVIFLMISNLGLMFLALSSKSKTILIPSNMGDELVIYGDVLPNKYISEMSRFFLYHLINLTKSNIDYNQKAILSHANEKSYHLLSNYFESEKEKYLQYDIVSSLRINEIKINGLKCYISGILERKFAQSKTREESVKYVLEYKNTHGRLEILNFWREDEKTN